MAQLASRLPYPFANRFWLEPVGGSAELPLPDLLVALVEQLFDACDPHADHESFGFACFDHLAHDCRELGSARRYLGENVGQGVADVISPKDLTSPDATC